MKNLSFSSLFLVLMLAGVGAFIGNTLSQNDPQPLQLNASTISNDDDVTISTGLVDKNASGLYILDHVNGELQCWLFDQNSGEIVGTFRTNVFEDIRLRDIKNPKFLMAVNYIVPNETKKATSRTGMSTCFVAETVSGKIATYQVAYDKKTLLSGRNQSGPLKVVSKHMFRDKK